MLKKNSVFLAAVYAFVAAIAASLIFSPIFGWFYILIFKPIITCGLSGLGCSEILSLIQNSIFAYLFFLPLCIMIFVQSKQWVVWLFMIFLPFTMAWVGGQKHILWFVIFTIVGGFFGWLIRQGLEILKRR